MDTNISAALQQPKPVIVFVNATRTWGGIKTWTLSLGHYLQLNGWRVLVICRPGDRLATLAQDQGLECLETAFGFDYNPFSIFRMWRIMRRFRVKVVVTNTSKCIRTGGIAGKLAGAKHVNRLGSYGDIGNRLKTRLDYKVWVDKVMVCSNSLRDHFRKFPWLHDKVNTFHNGTDFPPMVPKAPSGGVKPMQFAVVAMLSPRKQVDKVIQAFKALEAKAWHLHILGTGSEESLLKQLAADLGLSDRITFYGMIEPKAVLPAVDVGILYSNEEAFGTAIIEYMAHGCAVIASRTGGAQEIFERCQGTIGRLISISDKGELIKVLKESIEQPQQVSLWGATSYDEGGRHFSTAVSFNKVNRFLTSLTSPKVN